MRVPAAAVITLALPKFENLFFRCSSQFADGWVCFDKVVSNLQPLLYPGLLQDDLADRSGKDSFPFGAFCDHYLAVPV